MAGNAGFGGLLRRLLQPLSVAIVLAAPVPHENHAVFANSVRLGHSGSALRTELLVFGLHNSLH